MEEIASELLPPKWDSLPLELQTAVLKEISPNAAFNLGLTSTANKGLVMNSNSQREYVQKNFVEREIVIPGNRLPLSWLYGKYPMLKVIIPYKVKILKDFYKGLKEDFDMIIRGKTFMDYINGQFTASFNHNGDIVAEIKATAVFDLATSNNYLNGEYTLRSLSPQGVEMSVIKIMFKHGEVWGKIISTSYGEQGIESFLTVEDAIGNSVVYQHNNDILIRNIYNNYPTGIDQLEVNKEVQVTRDNGAEVRKIITATVNANGTNNDSSITTIYIEPYPEYSTSAKLAVKYDENGKILMRSILDVYGEPVITKEYSAQTLNFRKSNTDYGYGNILQKFGYSSQFNWCLIPEPDQIRYVRVSASGALKVEYDKNGDIIELFIIDQSGNVVTDYNQPIPPVAGVGPGEQGVFTAPPPPPEE